MEEGKITFECRLVGEPRPDVSWYHNERKVEGRRHKVTLTEDESKMFYLVRLEISGVEAADAGTYKAVARNVTGEGHATINLTFEEGKYSAFTHSLSATEKGSSNCTDMPKKVDA